MQGLDLKRKKRTLLNSEELRKYFEIVGDNGDSIVYKKDGLRPQKPYTVLISSGNQSFEAICCHDVSLSEAVKRAFQEYKIIKT